MTDESEIEEFLERFGAKLRKIRNEKDWSLEKTEEIAEEDIAWRHLQRIEHGKNVNLSTVYKIAKIYNIKLSDLFKGLN